MKITAVSIHLYLTLKHHMEIWGIIYVTFHQLSPKPHDFLRCQQKAEGLWHLLPCENQWDVILQEIVPPPAKFIPSGR